MNKIHKSNEETEVQRQTSARKQPESRFITQKDYGKTVDYFFDLNQLQNIDMLRSKYTAPKSPPPRPGFGSSQGRFRETAGRVRLRMI